MNTRNGSTYFIGIPRFNHHSLCGRGTKAHIAYSPSKGTLAFYKENWKVDLPRVHRELDVYRRLNEAEVPWVPTAIGGGPVEMSDKKRILTRSQIVFDPKRPPARELNCLVLREIALPLEEYEDAYHLVKILFDTIQGMWDCYWVHMIILILE